MTDSDGHLTDHATPGGYAGLDRRIAAAGSASIWVGDKIHLRGYEPEDAEFEKGYENSFDQRSGWRVTPPRSSTAQRASAEDRAVAKPEGDATQFRLAIARRTDDKIVGGVNTHSIDMVNGTFMFGVGVGAEAKGRGYAAEAVLLVMRYLFEERRLQKCESGAYAYNTASLALHRKLGFVEEGRLRRHVFGAGQYQDVCLFGMTVEEFRELYPALRPRLTP
jgi:RimJ/RimL family protein N-acetyltransferase